MFGKCLATFGNVLQIEYLCFVQPFKTKIWHQLNLDCEVSQTKTYQ